MTFVETREAYPAVETTFQFSKFAGQLPGVDAANLTFICLIEKIREDIDETERLLGIPSIHAVLENSPRKRTWVNNGIHNIESALNDIGLFIERIRLDKDDLSMNSFERRVQLVLQSSGKLENQRSELATCHQTLIAMLNVLSPLEFLTKITTIDPPPKVVPPVSETTTSEQDQCKSTTALGEESNTTMLNVDVDFFSRHRKHSAWHNQHRTSTSGVVNSESLTAEVPQPLFSQPLATFYSPKRFSHLPSTSSPSYSNFPKDEMVRGGLSVSTAGPHLSITTQRELGTTTKIGSCEPNLEHYNEALVSPLTSAISASSSTPSTPFSITGASQEHTRNEVPWKGYLASSSLRQTTSCQPISSDLAAGRMLAAKENHNTEAEPSDPNLSIRRQSAPPLSYAVELSVEKSSYKPYIPPKSYFNVANSSQNETYARCRSSVPNRGTSHIPSVLKPGTPIERNTYPPLSVPSVRPRSQSTMTPGYEPDKGPRGQPHQYNNQTRSLAPIEREFKEIQLEMPHHTHYLGRPHSTAPSESSSIDKVTMPHHLHYTTSPASERTVHMPHHLNYTRARPAAPVLRHEARPIMPHRSSYVPKPQAPYPTAPGEILAHVSPEIASRSGGWGAPQLAPQSRGPQSMMGSSIGLYRG